MLLLGGKRNEDEQKTSKVFLRLPMLLSGVSVRIVEKLEFQVMADLKLRETQFMLK